VDYKLAQCQQYLHQNASTARFQDLKFMENDKQAQCSLCKYWSGHARLRQGVMMCAVNIPDPSPAELKKNGDRIAFTWHNCWDFENAIIPVLGSHSDRCNSLEAEEDEDDGWDNFFYW
jgi:hypothetical protein